MKIRFFKMLLSELISYSQLAGSLWIYGEMEEIIR